MTYYRPRMAATLTVPVIGTRAQRINQEASTEAIQLQVRPKHIHIESNDHNHADSASLVGDWTEIGVDARMLDNACLQIFVANADEDGYWQPSERNCRFIGLAKDVTSDRSADGAAEVTIECLDYTTLFLSAKPFGSSGVPKYDQKLDDALRTIVKQTPGAEMFLEPGRFDMQGFDEWPELGKAVSDRFKKLAHVPTHPETDAWAVLQQCVGMCGLIAYIKLDKLIVTTATNYYSESDSPVLVWGENILEWGEVRHSELSRKGVGLTAYNALTQTTLEAFYPAIGDDRIKAKRSTAKKVQSQEQIRSREERDWFSYPGVTEQSRLDEIAQRVWEERSRQELEGHVKTAEMNVETESGADFDLLSLAAGDCVRVTIDPQSRQLLAALGSDSERRDFLLARGYSSDAANLIIRNMADFARLDAKFLVKSATIELSTTDDGGSFSVEFEYVNRIQIDGSAVS